MLSILPLEHPDALPIVQWNEGKNADFLQQWSGQGYEFPITEQQIIDRLKKSESSGFKIFKIELDETMIGTVELIETDETAKSAYIGRFLINPDLAGKGYGTKAMQKFLEMLFQEMHLESAQLTVFDFNKSAMRCYEKVGFKTIRQTLRPNGWVALRMEITSTDMK